MVFLSVPTEFTWIYRKTFTLQKEPLTRATSMKLAK